MLILLKLPRRALDRSPVVSRPSGATTMRPC